ncbi:OmpL47-type beta-barrel domain-containing protein [uncultured Phycicoccus sp.]|uniref:OmpL47-type beta-barrel domain-containing protein n=1 Tax=uncultured Phycicoccus sp. TaxID=661422 RepID=UPI0026054924|nr:PxKF domain-containing protein [uncultured Phycicoccus sp.]
MLFRQNTAPSARHARPVERGTMTRGRRLLAVTAAAATALLGGVGLTPAHAVSVTSASFSGGAGTVNVGGTLYAKQGAVLTLTVGTSNDTQCVEVTGAANLPTQSSPTAKTTWTFTLTAPAGDGTRAFTVTASRDVNNQGKCTGPSSTGQASYVLDNTGPVVSSTLTPAPNGAGWNNTDVTVRWTATDTGSGVAAAQPFKTDTVNANGIANLTAPAQADRLGNTGAAGAVTVRVDKTKPTITAAQTKNADGSTTVAFTCNDTHSGIASCLADGSTTNSRTVQPGVTVTGTATDRAGNTNTATSTAPAGDTTAPLLSGAPTTQPNGDGWYRGDVTIRWTASDPESGIPTPPANTTIAGEGTGLTSTTAVTNGAGLSTTATSSPAVKIDRTAPTTGITGTSNQWSNGNVTLTLLPTDNLSGVASTTYTVDGGTPRTGTSVLLETEGVHTVTYSSTDKAGNAEAPQTATVRIDKTAPTIGHAFDPASYTDGTWTNGDVTVTFTCADQGGSGVASCTDPVTKTAEGAHTVQGTATDGAGNTATDTASVRIDKTAPTISATAVGAKNAADWYKDDVRVEYTASDALSGIAGSPKAAAVLGEGRNQEASSSVTDAAGNTASAGVSGINVDKTAPSLTGSFASGWHTGDVTVTWECTDALSGPAGQPAASVVEGEGKNLSATASCSDVAGNTTTTTVAGITIDRTAPTTLSDVTGAQSNGWYRGSATVTLTPTDGLSGVDRTWYTVNGGDAKTYSGPVELTADGEYTVAFWSRDRAGNLEVAGAPVVLKVDGSAPVTTRVNPISPASGWFVTSGIPFAFDAYDARSGVAATYYVIDDGERQTYGQPFTRDLSDGPHQVTYWSTDLAGNVEAKETFGINIDTVPPTITGATVNADGTPRSANEHGWFNTPVDVKFTCTDTGSGPSDSLAGCAGDTTLSNDGAGQYVTGDAMDIAGNRNSTRFGPVNLDQTRPTLTGVRDAANGAGWYNGDVTVTWRGDDGLSGIDPATQPAKTTVTGEGDDLTAGPVTIRDKAGNTSLPATVTGLKIDRTAPVVTGAPTTEPNAANWYSGKVIVDFRCADALSGVASCPTSKMLEDDGAGQSVTSDRATDRAGNLSAPATVGGINIDGTAPQTTANNTCTAVNEWCTGDTADVVLTATDQAGLSGVKEIQYRVDNGTTQVVAGSTATVSVPLNGSGAGTVEYWAVDRAGNTEQVNKVTLKWDNIAPAVSHTLSPAPNADKWNNSDVTVTFSAKDDDKGSGVAPGSVTAPVTVSTETPGKVVTGTAKDTAGNTGTDSVTVKLDKTRPTISGKVTAGTLTASGWYSGPVTVTFTCTDALSGVATCPDPVVLTANGTNTASGTATDKAGNTATAEVADIRIDQEKPTLTTADVNVNGATYTLGSVPAATCTATDAFSGLASCTVMTTGGKANGVGTFTYTATATDKAGNSRELTGTYRVIYRFDGFLQPINDTAHQVAASTSIFKAGSTVPAKLQLKRADGTVVQATTAPVWLTPVKGSSMSAPVIESVYTESADSGSTYRYDSGQYIYNWKTGNAGGNYWRVGVTLDDGQTYYVNIGTR